MVCKLPTLSKANFVPATTFVQMETLQAVGKTRINL
jgi:hypothetical protein